MPRYVITVDAGYGNEHEIVEALDEAEAETETKAEDTNTSTETNAEVAKEVVKNIGILKKNDSSIVGYGAPAKATTALNFFNISKEIDYIVEDNKLKHSYKTHRYSMCYFPEDLHIFKCCCTITLHY